MPAKGQKKCPVCEKMFTPIEGNYTLYHNRYYHNECYEYMVLRETDIAHGQGEDVTDKEWIEVGYRYLRYEIKMDINYRKYAQQWNNYLKKHMTSENIFYALRYFYSICNGNRDKSNGGIGIIPYIYDDSVAYWNRQSELKARIRKEIIPQLDRIMHSADENVVTMPQSEYRSVNKRPLKTIDLAAIQLEDEE